MLVHMITLNQLSEIIPDEVLAFRSICTDYGIDTDDALRAIAKDDYDYLEGRNVKEGQEDEVFNGLIRLFNIMNEAFRVATLTPNAPPLLLEPHYNDDRNSDIGVYIRIKHSVLAHPGIKNLNVTKKDLQVYNSKAVWEEEFFHTGL